MVEFPQSVPNLTEPSTNLYEIIKGRNLVVYPDEGLRRAVHQAVTLETSRGWRIAKEKQAHRIDVVVALAQAALGAVKQQCVPGAGWLEVYRRDHDAINGAEGRGRWRSGSRRAWRCGSRRTTSRWSAGRSP